MTTRMECPDDLTGYTARALLLLKAEGRFDTATLGTNLVGCSIACGDLEGLGWPVRQVPGSRPDAWELRAGSVRDDAQRRFRSRGFAEWQTEAEAAIAGREPPAKPKPVVDSSAWKPGDFTAMRGARLSTPQTDSLAFLLLYAVFNLGRAEPELVDLKPLAFVAAAQQLEESGWPMTLDRKALVLRFEKSIPENVIEAWRDSFGARGRHEALNGTIGKAISSGSR